MAAPHFSSKDSGLRLRYSRALELIETLIDQTDELKGRVAFLEVRVAQPWSWGALVDMRLRFPRFYSLLFSGQCRKREC